MSLDALGWNAQRQREFADYARQGLIPGRIIGEHRTHYQVALQDEEIAAEIPGRMRNAAELRSDLPGVGDYVALSPSAGDGPAIIEAVLPRTSALIRQAAGERRPQLVASNVDVVLIVTALDGDFNLDRLIRYLALIDDGGAEAVIIINKADIGAEPEVAMAELQRVAPDVAVHVISAHSRQDVAVLEKYFEGGRTIAVLGSSGVGKSTLTNQLLGYEAQATQAVRARDNRGQHTTTHRQLFIRDAGGAIMDTPGMRGLELWDADPVFADDAVFDAIETLATACKFRNCGHDSEPGCAVRAAIKRGEIDVAALERYLATE
ncbi:MAG: ribosome small subunit-dependent GTPase A [Hyphomicrobiaceae bacterium]